MQDQGAFAARLLAMASHDAGVRAELAATGELFAGYHPRMAEVHRANAASLREVVAVIGWPVPSQGGDEGAAAAWLVLQHAIGDPEFQRAMLPVLWECASRGEIPAVQAAYLEDRVRAFEGRPQRFGTQWDWDQHGELSLTPPVEDPDTVDDRRAEVGLPPLSAATAAQRSRVATEGERPPVDWAARQRAMNAWATSVGWR